LPKVGRLIEGELTVPGDGLHEAAYRHSANDLFDQLHDVWARAQGQNRKGPHFELVSGAITPPDNVLEVGVTAIAVQHTEAISSIVRSVVRDLAIAIDRPDLISDRKLMDQSVESLDHFRTIASRQRKRDQKGSPERPQKKEQGDQYRWNCQVASTETLAAEEREGIEGDP
jgi:hypothetical protein